MIPQRSAWTAPRAKTSRLFSRSVSASSRPMLPAITSSDTFSSWPVAALVAGVKIGVGSRSPSPSPRGSATPQTVPLRWYSVQPEPANRPRTTHSNGITCVRCTSIERPRKASRSGPKCRSIPSMSVARRWWAIGSAPAARRANQNAEMLVSRRPLSGIGVGSTQSKALMRSVLTISIVAPSS